MTYLTLKWQDIFSKTLELVHDDGCGLVFRSHAQEWIDENLQGPVEIISFYLGENTPECAYFAIDFLFSCDQDAALFKLFWVG